MLRIWTGLKLLFCKELINQPNLDLSKLKVLADNKMNATLHLKFVLERIESNLGKGENAGYQHFLLFPQCFKEASSTGLLKVGTVW